MRSTLLAFMFSACCCTILLSSACKRDRCKKVNCENGECVDGQCVCPVGYEGSSCAEPVNSKFDTTFTTTESCTAGSDSYSLVFVPQAGSQQEIKLAGLWDKPSDTVFAVVDENGLDFSIARQSYSGFEIEGTGKLASSRLSGNIDYRVYNTGESNAFDNCSLTFE